MPQVLSNEEFELFQKFLIEESGLYFDKDRSQSLDAVLAGRLRDKKYGSYQEYYNFLKFHPEGRREVHELLDLITIGETCFFRNRPNFEALMTSILPEIINKKMYSADKSIRVWSAGCSKGDEAYSIAIAIMEALPVYKNWNISILGTDINRDVLDAAREGIYGKRDIEQMPQEYFEKYFSKAGTKFVLNDDVKNLVKFEYHNLAKDPFLFEGVQNLDIIFCRNVTIYFDLDTTRRVMDNFYNCLLPDGYLFIGHSETLWQITDKFRAVEFPQTFIYKKGLYPIKGEAVKPFIGVPDIDLEEFSIMANTATAATDSAGRTEVPGEGVPLIRKIEKKDELRERLDSFYKEAIRLSAAKQYKQAVALLNRIISQDKNHTKAYFAKAAILANQENYQEAIKQLLEIIETDNLYIEAYYLLGVLAYKTGDVKMAEAQFRKIIYIDPSVAMAYFNLGNIYLYQDETKKAAKEFNNAVKLLEVRPLDEQVRFGEDFAVDFLLRACRINLEKIDKEKKKQERGESIL